MEIIGLAGYAQTGKDTIGHWFVQERGYLKLAFADGVRCVAARLNPILIVRGEGGFFTYRDLIQLYGYEDAKNKFAQVRGFLVDIGAGLRETMGDDIWVNVIDRTIDNVCRWEEPPAGLVITDIRYPNEARMLRTWGAQIYRVHRAHVGPANEEEERSLKDVVNDSEIFNDFYSVDGLYEVLEILFPKAAVPA